MSVIKRVLTWSNNGGFILEGAPVGGDALLITVFFLYVNEVWGRELLAMALKTQRARTMMIEDFILD